MTGSMSRACPCLVLPVLLSACAALPPPPPVLPVLPDRSAVMMSLGRTCLPATAMTTSPETGPVAVKQTWEGDFGDSAVPAFFDPRLAISELLSPYVGLALAMSWSQVGIDLRIFPRGLEVKWPVLLSLGAQTDGLGNAAMLGGTAWNVRVGAGLLPRLSERAHLMLGASGSYGSWRFRLALPQSLMRNETDNFLNGDLQIVRRELRAEGMLGIVFPVGWRWRAFATLEPFTIVDHGGLGSGCGFCVKDLTVTSFTASWGLAFQLGWVL